jgi:hypothetical protein
MYKKLMVHCNDVYNTYGMTGNSADLYKANYEIQSSIKYKRLSQK